MKEAKQQGAVEKIARRIEAATWLPLWLAYVAAVAWIGLWCMAQGPAMAAGWAWGKVLALAEWAFGSFAWCQKLKEWWLARVMARCDRLAHAQEGRILPGGQPARACVKCGYVVAVTPREFRRLFGISVEAALRRCVNRGKVPAAEVKAWKRARIAAGK